MKVRTRPLLLAAALLASALVPLATPAAADTGPVSLGMATLGQVVLDEERGHLFLSGGPSGPGVKVTDLAGTPVATLGFAGATGMALTPDGSRLWLALPDFGLVSVDTTTLTADRRWAVDGCPGDVAVVGSRLVYGYSCNRYSPQGGSYGGVGVLDAATGASYGTVTTGPHYQPVVTPGPAGQVYAADAGLSDARLSLYDVTGGAPRLVAALADSCENLRDLSAAPDGSRVVTSCGYPYRHSTWSSNKLEPLGSYTTGAYPLAGAWSADGRVFAAGDDSAYGTDVSVFAAGATSPSWERDFGSSYATLQPRGLAVSRDGSRAWAVSRSATGELELRVLGTPALSTASLTLAADPPSFFVGEGTDVGGWLSSGSTGIGGVPVSVTRAATGAAPVVLPSVTTSANGTFSIPDSPVDPGSYTYTATWAGDATRGGVSATEQVTVHPLGSSLDLRLEPGFSAPNAVLGSVFLRYSGTASPGARTVRISRTGGGAIADLPPVTTDEWGGAEFTDLPPAGTHEYTVTVDADGTSPGASASATITTGLVTTMLTAKAPATASADTPLTVSGQLTTAGTVLPGATVSVIRSGCSTGWSDTAVTTPNGAWSVTDPLPQTGTCTYRASYAGDGRHAPSEAAASTAVTVAATGLTVVAPTTAEVGSPLPLRGTLSTATAAVSGAPVTVARSGCSTDAWSASVVTGADGTWSAADPSPPVGSCAYTATYAGNERYASAKASASARVDLRKPALTLSVVRGTGSAKKTAYVTAQLGPTLTNRVLTITAQPSGGAEVVLRKGTVDSAGQLATTYVPKTITTYRVHFSGDDWYAPATAERLQ